MDVDSLVGTVFSGLSALVVEDVAESGGMVVVTARTRDVAVPCPVCGTATAKAHGYHHRAVKDVPVDGRQVVVHLRARRLVCQARSCPRQTFREQVPGLLERHQRRTVRLVRMGNNGEAVLSELISQAVTLAGVPNPSPRWTELADLALIRVRLIPDRPSPEARTTEGCPPAREGGSNGGGAMRAS